MTIAEDIRGYAGAVQARLATAAAEASMAASSAANGIAARLPEPVRELAGKAQGVAAGAVGTAQATLAALPEKAEELRGAVQRDPRLGKAYGAVEAVAGAVIEKVIVPAAGLIGYRPSASESGSPAKHTAPRDGI